MIVDFARPWVLQLQVFASFGQVKKDHAIENMWPVAVWSAARPCSHDFDPALDIKAAVVNRVNRANFLDNCQDLFPWFRELIDVRGVGNGAAAFRCVVGVVCAYFVRQF